LNTNLFTGYEFRNLKPSGDCFALTDITFQGLIIDFNYSLLNCSPDINIVLDGMRTTEITFNGSGTPLPRLTSVNGNYLQNAVVIGFELYGNIKTHSGCTLQDVIVMDTLQQPQGYSTTLDVNGTLTNNGIVKNATSGNYTLDVSGDINNNGLFSNYTINLMHASNDQYISCDPAGLFAIANFYTNKAAGDIIALSDISFENTLIDGYNKTFDFSGGFDLSVDGGRFYRADLIGSTVADNYSVLFMDNGAYCYNSFGQNLELQGIVKTYGSASFEDVLVTGTLQNRDGYSVTTSVHGQLENQGTIKNSDVSGNFTLDLYGDIINDGTWSNYYIYLKGDIPQHISCLNASIFDLTYFACQNTADLVIADDDLNFSGTQIDFTNDDLDFTGGYNMSIDGGRLYRGNVMATQSSIFNFTNNAYFYNSTLDLGTLDGACRIYGTCSFGSIIINGVLENQTAYSATTTITGDIINNGEVRNNTASGNLTLNCQGNVSNDGLWTNYRTYFNGTTDQEILIKNDNDITGQVYFVSDITGSPYQWNFEGSPLNNDDFTGETGSTLTWLVPVSDAYFGTFYCQTGNGPSRNIIVGAGGLRLDITLLIEGPFNGTNLDPDLNGILPLSQPYSSSPWNYTGTESVASIPNANVVDWVLVELRDTTQAEYASSETMIAQQVAFLLNDGTIVGLDGSSLLSFNHSINHSLFVVIWHRNHLGVMSANAVTETGGVYTYDFTTGSGQAYGTNAQKNLGGGIYGIYAGDGDANGTVEVADKNNIWSLQAGKKGYWSGDFDMNGQVMNQDKNDVWLGNLNKQTQLPD